ncbi:hypothetical protein KIPB_001568 [Kipferlia bialata]|uniref:Uncharacterized protein n=1 Tax=Kipferlia bialata TaxID=797122 RepID=A0A9K3GE83_9EUKA|nr:hypothetical protein KIPB_001568 [Kipferlia bialata]|eukprot:g1568.t1
MVWDAFRVCVMRDVKDLAGFCTTKAKNLERAVLVISPDGRIIVSPQTEAAPLGVKMRGSVSHSHTDRMAGGMSEERASGISAVVLDGQDLAKRAGAKAMEIGMSLYKKETNAALPLAMFAARVESYLILPLFP